MRTRVRDGLLGSVALTAVVLGAGAHARAAEVNGAPASAADGTATLEEVVVSAEKRSDRALDVASSVSVVGAQQLESRDLSTMQDWATTVAGLNFSSRGAPGFTQVILRGVTSGSQQTSPAVGVYVDDTPFGTASPAGTSSLQPDIDPSDVARIEVLRGPQGTLYGAGTLGGIIKYVTRAPDATAYSAHASAGFKGVDGGGTGWDGRLTVNAPIVRDKVALRASLFARQDPGYITDPVDHHANANLGRVTGGRAALGLYPTEDLSVRLSVFAENASAHATGGVDLDPNTLRPQLGDLTNGRVTDDYFRAKYRIWDAAISWKVAGLTLTSSTSYGQIRSHALFDFTPAFGFIVPLYSGGAIPAGDILGPQNFSSNKLTEEARVEGRFGQALTWRIGGFYTHEDLLAATQVLGVNPTTFAPLPSLFGTLSNATSPATYQEEAVFADGRWTLSPAFELSAGVRYAHNHQTSSTTAVGLLVSGSAPTTPQTTAGSSSEGVVTYQVSGKWTWAKDQMAYFRVASGYRPGGPIALTPTQLAANVPSKYNADRVTNYELGTKGLFWDGRLSADADLFWVDWSDIQLPTLIGGFNVLSNGGGAVSKGLEANLAFKATRELTLGLRTAYTNAHLTTDATVAGYRRGDPLPAVPRWDISADADWRHPLNDTLTGALGFSVKYNSSRQTGQSQNALNPVRILPGFATVDLRAGLEWGRWAATVYVRNVGDQRAYTNGGFLKAVASQTVPYQAIVIPPRTFGATLSASF
ncbi:TonB-dependent receptor [Caulobacter sp. KR2-114]|uniref:TonB-dependent receptor n=1 Tax=Caulobacter sp. KR2-114 TaxID=3400912 RepID=UPI003C03EC21